MLAKSLLPAPKWLTWMLCAAMLAEGAPTIAQPATCPVTITAFSVEGARYDPLGDGFSGTITAQVESRTDEPCEAELQLTDSSGSLLRLLDLPGYTLPLRLELLAAPGVTPLAHPAKARLLIPTNSPPLKVHWLAFAQASQLLPPGDYAMPITARSGDASLTSQLAFASPARAQVSFAGGSPNQTIDLGVLQPGKRGRAVLQVRANTHPSITLVSANRGHLSNVNVPGATILYALTLDGTPIDLRSEWRQAMTVPINQHGQMLQIEVSIGEFAGALAGSYRDDVTIEISP